MSFTAKGMSTLARILMLCILFFPISLGGKVKDGKSRGEISVSCAWFDFIQKRNEAFELTFEYRSAEHIWIFRPFIGVMTTEKETAASYAGILTDINLFSGLFLTPSFAPCIYYSGMGKEMYYGLEFRSQVELSYEFKSFRLGININHISNGHLYRINPGVESLSLNLIMPLK